MLWKCISGFVANVNANSHRFVFTIIKHFHFIAISSQTPTISLSVSVSLTIYHKFLLFFHWYGWMPSGIHILIYCTSGPYCICVVWAIYSPNTQRDPHESECVCTFSSTISEPTHTHTWHNDRAAAAQLHIPSAPCKSLPTTAVWLSPRITMSWLVVDNADTLYISDETATASQDKQRSQESSRGRPGCSCLPAWLAAAVRCGHSSRGVFSGCAYEFRMNFDVGQSKTTRTINTRSSAGRASDRVFGVSSSI